MCPLRQSPWGTRSHPGAAFGLRAPVSTLRASARWQGRAALVREPQTAPQDTDLCPSSPSSSPEDTYRRLLCVSPPCWHHSLDDSASARVEAGLGQLSGSLELEARPDPRQKLEWLYTHQRLYESGPPAPHALDGVLPLSNVLVVAVDGKPPQPKPPQQDEKSADYYANMGDAIRTLREDIPRLFNKDLNYSIYREDVLFRDPRNSFRGLKNYKTIFWSLRFHGRLFFSKLFVEVRRIWQPEDGIIRMRWTVHGVPRVPWEAEGIFDGVSQYRLDSCGKVYEHAVDNVILRDPPFFFPLLANLSLVPQQQQQQPVPGACGASSWSCDQACEEDNCLNQMPPPSPVLNP